MLQNKTHCTCGYRRKQSVKVQNRLLQYITGIVQSRLFIVLTLQDKLLQYRNISQYVTVYL